MQASSSRFSKRLLRLALPAACLYSAVTFAQAQPPQPLIGQMEQAIRAGQFADALRLSNFALQRNPRDIRIWTLQGIAYAGSGQLPRAFTAYQRALQLKADYVPALEGAAQVAYQRADPAAESLLERLLRVRPEDPNAHGMLGVIIAKKGDCGNAILHFTKAEQAIVEQPQAHAQFGLCLAANNRIDEAVEQFRMTQALQPSDSSCYNLSLALWNAKRYDEAHAALQPALEHDQRNEDILTLAADIEEARNDTPQAVEMLNRAIQGNPQDVRGYLWLANLANDHASFQVGIDMLSAGLRLMPHQGQLHLARGILYAQLGNFDRATDDFEAAHRLDPQLSFSGTAEGIIASQKHDLDASIERFRSQVRNHPSSAFDQYLLAESLRQKGAGADSPEFAEAMIAAKKAVALEPALSIAREILADLYLTAEKPEKAAAECEEVLKRDTNDQEALYRLILALRKLDRRDEVPALTHRLLELRSERKSHDSRVMNYELVDNVSHSAGPASGASNPKP